jgi:hypothetical protein
LQLICLSLGGTTGVKVTFQKASTGLALITVILSPLALAAQTSLRPPKDANVAVVWVTGAQDQAYRAFARYLVGQGFTLKSTDASLLIIQTEFHDTRRMGSGVRLKVSASVDSSEMSTKLLVRGRFSVGNLTSEDGMEIEYGGAGGSLQRKTFDEFSELLTGFPADSVVFEKR